VAATLVHIALLAYLVAAACYLSWLLWLSPKLVAAGRSLLFIGLVAHVGAFASARELEAAWRGGQLFSLLAAATVALYLIVDFRSRIPVAGAFVAPLTIAAMVPAHLVHAEAQHAAPVLTHSVVLPLHVGAATLGTGALLVAFALALLYLAGEKQLKSHSGGRLLARLPSLALIDKLGWQLTLAAFVLLSIAIVTGSFVMRTETGGLLRADAKESFALLAWAFLAALVQARLVAGWRGRRAALLVVIGFLLLVCSYAGLLARTPLGVPHAASAARSIAPSIHRIDRSIRVEPS
jgi:ABC-type uncharacterized transport system permease subunit